MLSYCGKELFKSTKGSKINTNDFGDLELEIPQNKYDPKCFKEYYYYDSDSKRYYQLVDSISLRKDMDGARVNKRISKKCFDQVKQLIEQNQL